MDLTNKRLTQKQKIFFTNLSNYIDKPIYFYGSIQRPDYIPEKSDIDIDIFTDNETSTIQMLSNHLNIKVSEFKKIIYKIKSTMVYGYKTKYEDVKNNINIELSIYNEKNKDIVLKDHESCKNLPFYITIVLYIIKVLFYNFKIISKKMYKRLKQFLMNPGDEMKFIEINSK
jgi:predicted nucleotidyltransferase